VRALGAGEFAWTVVTSVNAIEALRDAAGRAGVDLAGCPARWAAVGPATRHAVEATGARVDLLPADGDPTAAGLVAAFEDGDGGRVLLPLGDLASATLPDGLAVKGWRPDVVTAYRTVRRDLPPDVVARAAAFDLVVVTSGSVAREVARQLGTDTAVVAIGRPSADAAREAGLTVTAVADRPTDDGLAAAVGAALSIRPTSKEHP
jgi:uroporphyrinogen-III synthase